MNHHRHDLELARVSELYQTHGRTGANTVLLLRTLRALNRIAKAIERLHSGRLHLSVTLTPKEPPVSNISVSVSSTQDVQFQTNPQDANAHPTTPSVAWSSSDPAVVELEVSADTRSARGVTRGAGTATISASADGYDTDTCDVAVTAMPNGQLGLTAAPIAKA